MIGGQQALTVVAIDPKLVLGKGRCKLSWIWYTVGRAEHGFGPTRSVWGMGGAGPGPVSEAHTHAKTVHTAAVDGCEAHWAMTRVRRHSFPDMSRANHENGDRNRNRDHNHLSDWDSDPGPQP